MLMMEENEDLAFYLPVEDGFNLFTDAMCIPACAQEKDAAEQFINFLTAPEISGANMDYICYASPVSAAKEHMEDYIAQSEVVYPEPTVLEKGTSFGYLPEETSRYVESLYQKATKVAAEEETTGNGAVIAIVAVLVIAGAGVVFSNLRKRKKKS